MLVCPLVNSMRGIGGWKSRKSGLSGNWLTANCSDSFTQDYPSTNNYSETERLQLFHLSMMSGRNKKGTLRNFP